MSKTNTPEQDKALIRHFLVSTYINGKNSYPTSHNEATEDLYNAVVKRKELELQELEAKNERLNAFIDNKIRSLQRQIDDPEVTTTKLLLLKLQILTELKKDIEQVTQTKKGE